MSVNQNPVFCAVFHRDRTELRKNVVHGDPSSGVLLAEFASTEHVASPDERARFSQAITDVVDALNALDGYQRIGRAASGNGAGQ